MCCCFPFFVVIILSTQFLKIEQQQNGVTESFKRKSMSNCAREFQHLWETNENSFHHSTDETSDGFGFCRHKQNPLLIFVILWCGALCWWQDLPTMSLELWNDLVLFLSHMTIKTTEGSTTTLKRGSELFEHPVVPSSNLCRFWDCGIYGAIFAISLCIVCMKPVYFSSAVMVEMNTIVFVCLSMETMPKSMPKSRCHWILIHNFSLKNLLCAPQLKTVF